MAIIFINYSTNLKIKQGFFGGGGAENLHNNRGNSFASSICKNFIKEGILCDILHFEDSFI